LDTDPIVALNSALVEACNYHVAQSRNDTNKEIFDITQTPFQLYPAEILAVIRLREQRGLQQPTVDHPLMDMPTAKLRPPIQHPVIYPEFLVETIAKAKVTASEYTEGL
jgi:hypothetical protein